MFCAFLSLCSLVVFVIVSTPAPLFFIYCVKPKQVCRWFLACVQTNSNTSGVGELTGQGLSGCNVVSLWWVHLCCAVVSIVGLFLFTGGKFLFHHPVTRGGWSSLSLGIRQNFILTSFLIIMLKNVQNWQRLRCQQLKSRSFYEASFQMTELYLVTLNLHSVSPSVQSASASVLACWTVRLFLPLDVLSDSRLKPAGLVTVLFLFSLFVFDCAPKVGRTPLWK